MKVLVIDDSSDVLDSVSFCLKIKWPEALVLTAQTGAAGLLLAGQATPDLVILDVSLPDVRGLDVLLALKQSLDVPVLMLSAYDQVAGMAAYLRMGAAEYIVKPFLPGMLLASVESILQGAAASPRSGPPTARPGGAFALETAQ